MKNEIIRFDTPELKVIEESKAKIIKETFAPMAEMLTEFENSFNEIIKESEKEITGELSAKAKRLRLDIGKVRIETGKLKDKQKAKIKLEDKAIMGVHNILVWAVTEKEDKLKEIENFAEIKEQKRLNELQSGRALELENYGVQFIPDNLSSMDEDVWVNYLLGAKLSYDQRIEAEKKAEDEKIEKEKVEKLNTERKSALIPYFEFLSIANQKITNFGELPDENFISILNDAKSDKQKFDKEQIEIRLENERLKKEADLNKKKDELRQKAGKARQEMLFEIGVNLDFETCADMTEKEWTEYYESKNNEYQKEQNRIYLKKLKAEKEKQEREAKEAKTKAENEAKLKIEREKREKIEAELKAKAEKEKQDAIAKENRIQSELKKGDNAKIQDLKNDLIALKTKYSFKAKKNKIKLSNVCILIDKVVAFIDE